jgi:predicted ATP-dependent endonuclease of OLD family
MEGELNVLLKQYNASTSIKLDWDNKNAINIQPPKPDMKIVADHYATQVQHAGHGSQRVLIMAMLQYRVQTKAKQDHSKIERKNLNIVIGIEEPELHQHPNSLYSIAQTFRRFTEDSSSEDQLQIVYTTHHASLVDLTDLENLRIVRKKPAKANEPLQTEVKSTTTGQLMNLLNGGIHRQRNKAANESKLGTTIQTIMTADVKMGFFADLVVLVEGTKDKAALIGVSRVRDCDLRQLGISVIPCGGKENMDKIIATFKTVDIPVYAIWDNDFNENIEKKSTTNLNKALLQLCSKENDFNDLYKKRIGATFACFHKDLDGSLSEDLGQHVYNNCLKNSCESLDLESDKGKTSSDVMSKLFILAEQKDKPPKTLISILDYVTTMRKNFVDFSPS